MKKFLTFTIAALLLIVGATGAVAKDKIKIEKLDDLPRHEYKIKMTAVELLGNDKALMKLANQVRKDLEADLKKYEIEDKTTLKGYYGGLGVIAMLDGRYDDYLKYREMVVDLEEKEAVKLTNGLFTRSYIKALKSGKEELEPIITKVLTHLVNELPYEVVSDEIKGSKARAEIINENLILGSIEASVQPILDESDGVMSKDIAQRLVGSGYTIRNFLPYSHIVVDVYSAYLDANAVEKEDIWEARDVALSGNEKGSPVVIAVWDSGTDVDCFKGNLFTNEGETPGNGKDDDNNGYVDDAHGIAYTLHSDKTTEMLYPIGDVEADRPRLQMLMKGLTDLTSNIDSEESSQLKKMLGTLEQAEVQPFIEDISKYGNYCHGTHVAGIAMRDNPYARILTTRLTFGHTMIPEEPTIELAEKEAVMYEEVLDYFKKNNVRVVNMSWGGSLAGIEGALEANNVGETPEERKELARKIFEIGKQALYKAIESAPEILFVTSAGNSDNDVTFEEFLPSSFDLPNIMSVGAVDQAGDETDFTSFGKVDVYANGFEVNSYVPGGDQMKLSGTSQASPNVTNLAAKLIALKPDLTVTQVRELIEGGCDKKMAGDRAVMLINPQNTIKMLKNM